jgi:hypothetical protein
MAYTIAFHLVIGISLYLLLASLPKVELFKLFNVFGLAFDIFGVLLLSKMIAKSTEKYTVLLDYFYAFLHVAIFCIPLGLAFGSLLFFWLNLPSSSVILGFSASIIFYVSTPLFMTDYAGEIFKFKFYESVSSRIVFMGWYLVVAGLALQMVGAILDLSS